MLRFFLMILTAACLFGMCPANLIGQQTAPTPRKSTRTSGVKIAPPAPTDKKNSPNNSSRGSSAPVEIVSTKEKARLEAEKEAARKKREEDKQLVIDQAAAETQKYQDELAAKEKELEESRAEAERIAKEKADMEQKAEAEASARQEAEKARIENERIAAEKRQKEQAEREVNRLKMIEMIAHRLGYLDVKQAASFVTATSFAAMEIETALAQAVSKNPRLVKEVSFCEVNFALEPLNLELTADDTFGTLLEDLRLTFGVNFLPDAEILDLPVRVNVQNVPWNIVLCQQLSVLDIEARYVGNNVISLIKRSKMLSLQDSRRKTAPTSTEYIKLKYLRPVIGGQSNLAGKSTGTASIETLEQTIQKILAAGGDNRGSISRIPGRAEFFITATDAQLEQIRHVIAKADRPTYRVDVFGLVYTVNENKLKDVGSQLSALLNAPGRVSGFTTLTGQQQSTGTGTGTGTGANQNSGGLLGQPFGNPSGLQAGSPNSILGVRVKLGLIDFNYQLSLLEQLGVARRVEKPFVSAKDGTTGIFENGTQIPVIIQALNTGGANGSGTIEFINAGTTLSATPQVIEDENGVPHLVNLSLRLESNTPDLSIQTSGNVPSVNSRRIQNEITIAPNQAFIFGGSNDITDSSNVSRTPVLGEMPVFGNLFKRKSKQRTDNKLYFAVWVQISLDDGTSPVGTENLDTNFPAPPPMNAPLTLPRKKP